MVHITNCALAKKTIKKRKKVIEIFGIYINNTYLYSVIKKIQKWQQQQT